MAETQLDALTRSVEQIRDTVSDISRDAAATAVRIGYVEESVREIRELLTGERGLLTRTALIERGVTQEDQQPSSSVGAIRKYGPWTLGGLAALGELLSQLFRPKTG